MRRSTWLRGGEPSKRERGKTRARQRPRSSSYHPPMGWEAGRKGKDKSVQSYANGGTPVECLARVSKDRIFESLSRVIKCTPRVRRSEFPQFGNFSLQPSSQFPSDFPEFPLWLNAMPPRIPLLTPRLCAKLIVRNTRQTPRRSLVRCEA
ncbi:hypothetical protein KM043_008266 [Ampulex compressa]|nr:hypothetical protein KM043_008266 [Ampulex compressa]